MSYLSIKYAIAVDSVLPHQSAGVLAEVMENLNNLSVLQDLLQFRREWIDLGEIKYVAVASQSNLKNLWLSLQIHFSYDCSYLD
jgi:hypothetical protein